MIVALLSLAPIAGMIPGGEADPAYNARILDWLQGTVLCVGLGALYGWVKGRGQRSEVGGQELRGSSPYLTSAIHHLPSQTHLTSLPVFFALYCLIANLVFSAKPLLIDEVVQVIQARWYASGQLFVETLQPREFFSILHLVDLSDKTFSQFPAGGPAMLALGALVGAEWMVGPLFGVICVWLFWRLLPEVEPEGTERWRRGATLLFALAPFGVFMFGSHMNHVTALGWLMVATVSLARTVRASSVRGALGFGLLTGLGLGMAATIRPVDAAAFALPAAGWLIWRVLTALRGARASNTACRAAASPAVAVSVEGSSLSATLGALLLSGVGVLLPMLALFWVNARTTGSPFLFGYDQLWGAGHGIGFHKSPWGPVHTPLRGIELLSLYFTRLSTYLFETPFPALLPAIGALWFARRLSAMDKYLLVSGALLCGGYWAYWHDGFYLGPRFLLPLLPLLILWSARFPGAVERAVAAAAERAASKGRGLALRLDVVRSTLRASLVLGGLYAVVTIAIVRSQEYRNGLTSMRTDVEGLAARAGVSNALVLVQESWGAQMVARMWGAGITRSDTEVIYRNVDACKLELGLQLIESRGLRGERARAALQPLVADSARLVKSRYSPDPTERTLPGYRYAPVCEQRIAEDWQGFSHLAPFRAAQDSNIYARWLPGREGEITAKYPGRPVYRVSRKGVAVDAPLQWIRLN